MSERGRRPQLRVIAGGTDPGVARGGGPDEYPLEAWTGPDDSVASAPQAGEMRAAPASRQHGEEFCPRHYAGEYERRRIAADVDRLRYAIVDLATIELPASRLLQELNSTFDRPLIRDRLVRAIDCLSLFAEEWRLEELTEAARAARPRHADDDN